MLLGVITSSIGDRALAPASLSEGLGTVHGRTRARSSAGVVGWRKQRPRHHREVLP